MNSFVGLLKKDFRLTRKGLFVNVGIVFLINLAAYLYGLNFDKNLVPLGYALFSVGIHLFYLMGYMLYSLNLEGKQLHLWLHNEQPASSLMLSKFLNGLFSLIISLSISVGFLFLWYKTLNPIAFEPAFAHSLYLVVLSILISLVVNSLYIAVWITFAWATYKAFRNKIGRWSWLLVFFLLLIPQLIVERILHWLRPITDWGTIRLGFVEEFIKNAQLYYPNELVIAEYPKTTMVTGNYLIYLAITIGIFMLTSWMIDKKVEV